jgi:ribonuclease E
MILSAIGLPVPGGSVMTMPPPAVERAETVQPVTPAVGSGGASRAAAPDTGAGGTSQRQSARDEARVIRTLQPPDARGSARGAAPGSDRLAGPQPAFEIAVLEKLREDAMRIPPEERAPAPEAAREAPRPETSRAEVARATPPAGAPEATPDEGEAGRDAAEADRARDAAANRDADRARAADPAPVREAPVPAAAARAEPSRAEPSRERTREPADDGFDDARRMSEEPSPRRVDVTR